jgi:hypothetical protein
MKLKFLVNIQNTENGKWVARCASTKIQVECASKEEALEKIKQQFEQYLSLDAIHYLSEWKGNDSIVNCPEGKILLPVDIWKCKLTGETCPTQAQVFVTEEDEFRLKCSADEKKKEQILNTIKGNKYNGFHHVAGRLKCVLCIGKEYEKYHYPWEINSLSQYIDLLNDNFRVRFLRSGIDQSAYGFGLCADCFIGVISKLNLTTLGSFEKIVLDFYR